MTNLYRAVKQIKKRIDQKKKVYALFIDLKSAYNHIPHGPLFDRLADALDPDEILFEKAIYSRLKVIHGRHSFTPNVGVAQGSVASPAFFNAPTAPCSPCRAARPTLDPHTASPLRAGLTRLAALLHPSR